MQCIVIHFAARCENDTATHIHHIAGDRVYRRAVRFGFNCLGKTRVHRREPQRLGPHGLKDRAGHYLVEHGPSPVGVIRNGSADSDIDPVGTSPLRASATGRPGHQTGTQLRWERPPGGSSPPYGTDTAREAHLRRAGLSLARFRARPASSPGLGSCVRGFLRR